jgi:hypothetical protein
MLGVGRGAAGRAQHDGLLREREAVVPQFLAGTSARNEAPPGSAGGHAVCGRSLRPNQWTAPLPPVRPGSGRGHSGYPGAVPIEPTGCKVVLQQAVQWAGRRTSSANHRQARQLCAGAGHHSALGKAGNRAAGEQAARSLAPPRTPSGVPAAAFRISATSAAVRRIACAAMTGLGRLRTTV